MIEGAEDAALLADYRQYYTFEIVMSDAEGQPHDALVRAMKGSGGGRRCRSTSRSRPRWRSPTSPATSPDAPSAWGSRCSTRPSTSSTFPTRRPSCASSATWACSFSSPARRTSARTFTEVLDTIILVNKSLDGRAVYIDTEYPGDTAKQALARLQTRTIAGSKASARRRSSSGLPEIRAIRASDADGLLAVWRGTWPATYRSTLGAAAVEAMLRSLDERGAGSLMPEGTSAGFFAPRRAMRSSRRRSIPWGGRSSISGASMPAGTPAVRPRLSLMAAVRATAQGKPIECRVLEASTTAISFYAAKGFVAVGRENVEVMPGVEVACLVMRDGAGRKETPRAGRAHGLMSGHRSVGSVAVAGEETQNEADRTGDQKRRERVVVDGAADGAGPFLGIGAGVSRRGQSAYFVASCLASRSASLPWPRGSGRCLPLGGVGPRPSPCPNRMRHPERPEACRPVPCGAFQTVAVHGYETP